MRTTKQTGAFPTTEIKLALSLSLNARDGAQGGFDTGRTYYPRGQIWEETTTRNYMPKGVSSRLNLTYSPTQKTHFGLLYLGSLFQVEHP